MSHRHITFLSARSTSGFFLAEAINAHFVWAELVDDEDQVFDLEMGSGVLVKEANIFVINQNFRRQILKPRKGIWLAEPGQKLAFRVEYLDDLRHGIHGVEAVFAVQRNTLDTRKLAEAVTHLPDGTHIIPIGVIDLNAKCASVTDIQPPLVVESKVCRSEQAMAFDFRITCARDIVQRLARGPVKHL